MTRIRVTYEHVQRNYFDIDVDLTDVMVWAGHPNDPSDKEIQAYLEAGTELREAAEPGPIDIVRVEIL